MSIKGNNVAVPVRSHTPSQQARRAANAQRKLDEWVAAMLKREQERKADLFRRGYIREL